jgi:hypothetical protein
LTKLTAAQLAILRAHPQRVEYYLAVHKPRVVSRGTLATVPTYPAGSLTITNLLSGINLTAVSPGMTLRIGSAENLDDLGTVRIRKVPSGSTLYIGEAGSGLVNWAVGNHLAVVEDYRAWPIHHSYDTSTSRWLVDLETYTSQMQSYGPQAIMGPPAVFTLDGGKAVGQYVGNLSYSHSPGVSITSNAWSFPTGTIVTSAIGSSAAPINITYLDASPGGAYHTLRVNDSDGASHFGKRLTFVFGSGNSAPIQCGFEQISGGLKSGGYRTRIIISQSAASDVIQDGAQVILFEKASYGTVGSSVGGNYHGRDNVVLVGRILGESQRIEPFTKDVSFAVETLDAELRRTQAYDLFLESSSATSSWDMASGLTLDRAAVALTKYRSTIANITDFRIAGGIAGTNEIPYRDLPAGPVWEQLVYNYQAAFGWVAVDMQGTLWTGLDAQVTGLSANLDAAVEISKADRRDVMTIEKDHRDMNAQYRLYAVQGGTTSPLGAESPGARQGYFGGRQEVTRNLTVPDQDTLVTWSGNVRARENNPLKRVSIPLAGNHRYDSVPQGRYTVSLSPTDNLRGVNWNNKLFLGAETNITYNSAGQYSQTDLILEASVNGIGGSSITFPRTIIPISDPPPPGGNPPPGTEGAGTTVIAVTRDKIGRTDNFLADSPNWHDITGAITFSAANDRIIDFNLDPFDPENKAICIVADPTLGNAGIWRTTNLGSPNPTWTLVRSANTDFANGHYSRVLYSIASQGRVYVKVNSSMVVTAQYGVLYSDDHGATWTLGDTTATGSDNIDTTYSLAVGNHNADVVYIHGPSSAGHALYRSTDKGASWSLYTGTAGAVTDYGGPDIECPYAGNDSNDSTVYFWRNRDTGNLAKFDGSTLSNLSPTESGSTNLGQGRMKPYRILVATHDANKVYALRSRDNADIHDLIYSGDAGNTWETRSASLDDYSSLGAWPYNFDRIFMMTGNLSSVKMMYSIDGGYNFIDKTGDWHSTVGGTDQTIRIIPIWTI